MTLNKRIDNERHRCESVYLLENSVYLILTRAYDRVSCRVPFIVFVIRQFKNMYRRLKKENRAEKRAREKVIEAVNVWCH